QKQERKKGLMQQLLSGKKRFPAFVPSAGKEGLDREWQKIRLKNVLDYEQPIKYLVSSEVYDDSFNIPVLTAGKTFLLGYTNEEHNVFQQLPAIIFDDFTTDFKWVDFPFKAKSSAMKMLKPIDDSVNLRYVFEAMKLIRFPKAGHKRYWISEFSMMKIPYPEPEEQQKIASVLSAADREIDKLQGQLEKLQAQKKGLMQVLLTGEVRVNTTESHEKH
ncbi:MAG: restriction endonuclease subunit S, partial [Schleiferiaceae bacterium]|nr:restriction endonuclease subunit S [Schleiferiaceae bacterium]